MENVLKEKIKELLSSLDSVCDIFAPKFDLESQTINTVLEYDIINFILYLGHSDGNLNETESNFIKEIFDIDCNTDTWDDFVYDANINIDNITIPKSFKAFLIFDNAMFSKDNNATNIMEMYIDVFEIIGIEFIKIDKIVNSSEIIGLKKYIENMQTYYENQAERNNINQRSYQKIDELLNSTVNQSKVCNIKSSCFTVSFLGNTYNVPDNLIKLMDCRNFVSDGLIKLTQEGQKIISKYSQMKGMEVVSRIDWDVKHLQNKMRSIVYDVYQNLIDEEIYDVNKEEFVKRITSIEQLEEIALKISQNMLSEARKMQSINREYREQAYKSAVGSITGSGVRIFTNSFASFMTYSLIEKSILKAQAKKADEEYERALRHISDTSDDVFDKIASNGVMNKFLPALPTVFMSFNDELLSNYLVELSAHGKFSLDNIQDYSESVSNTILENMNHAKDKKSLLCEAFERCPINLDVYEMALSMRYCDAETIRDAAKIFRNSEIEQLLLRLIDENSNNVDLTKWYITMLAAYKNTDEKHIQMSVYKHQIDEIKNKYTDLKKICLDTQALHQWIMKNINNNIDLIVDLPDDIIEQKVSQWISLELCNHNDLEYFDMGIVPLEDIRMSCSIKNNLNDINLEYKEKLVENIKSYIREAFVRKHIYEQAYEKFNTEIEKRESVINEKEAELNDCGLFEFSKKKELKAIIRSLKDDLDCFKKTEPLELKDNYYKMYSK